MTVNQALSDTPWSFLKAMSRELYKLDQTPLLGYVPSFPWEQFAHTFSSSLGLQECVVTATDPIWRESSALCEGLSNDCFWAEIAATSISTGCFVAVPKSDLLTLMQLVLGISNQAARTQPQELQETFYHFLTTQTLQTVNSIEFDKRFSFKAAAYDKACTETALTRDIQLAIGTEKIVLRLFLPASFQTEWRAAYSIKDNELPPTKERLAETFTTLHVQAGKTALTLNELLSIQPGDFLLIDRPYYIPESDQHHVIVSLENRPFFRAELENGSLKILEIPLRHEVDDSMVDKVNPPIPPSKYTPGDLPSELPLIDEDENPFEDEDEDETDEEFDLVEEEVTEQTIPVSPKKEPTPTIKQTPKITDEPLKELTANDIPLTVIVEVAEIQMSAQKLMELQAGNVIDLDVAPESGVNLMVNGRVVGKGELLKIGDSIGVRILQMGTR
jgi:flagellar motor switch protein FliN